MSNSTWNDDSRKELRESVLAGKTLEELASIFGRDPRSVIYQLKHLAYQEFSDKYGWEKPNEAAMEQIAEQFFVTVESIKYLRKYANPS